MLAQEIEPSMLVQHNSKEWIAEPKYDGERALLHFKDGAVKVFNRDGRETTFRWKPELQAFPKVEREYVFDCEIVVFNEKGVPKFELLQKRAHKENGFEIELASKKYPAVFIIFDVLRYNEIDVTQQKLRDRKVLLEYFFTYQPQGYEIPTCFRPTTYTNQLLQAYENAEQGGWEGIMVKKSDSVYEVGKRSWSWLKVKVRKLIELRILGFETNSASTGFTAVTEGAHRVGVNGLKDRETIRKGMFGKKEVRILVEYQEKTDSGALRQPTCKKVWVVE